VQFEDLSTQKSTNSSVSSVPDTFDTSADATVVNSSWRLLAMCYDCATHYAWFWGNYL